MKSEQLAADVVERVELVRTHGWPEFQWVWSTGQSAIVALVLDDAEVLAQLDESEQSTTLLLAYDLWGLDGGLQDEENGLQRTHAWLREVRDRVCAG